MNNKPILSADTVHLRKQFIKHELIPSLEEFLSDERINKLKEEGKKYLNLNVEHLLKQTQDHGIIDKIGSTTEWSTYRIIYKAVEIPYSTFWHDIQKVLMEAGFEHINKALYRYDINKPRPIFTFT